MGALAMREERSECDWLSEFCDSSRTAFHSVLLVLRTFVLRRGLDWSQRSWSQRPIFAIYQSCDLGYYA
jgi:hypothetical protein